MDLRQRNIEMRKRRILEAARQLIAAEGLEGLSMRKLARQASLSVRTLYNLHGSKEQIVRGVIAQGFTSLIAGLERVPLDDPLRACRAIIDFAIDGIFEEEAVYRPLLVVSFDEMGAAQQTRVGAPTLRYQRDAIVAAMRRGLLNDSISPELLASAIDQGFWATLLLWSRRWITDEQARARALAAVDLALLAAATEKTRPLLLARLRALEPHLQLPVEFSDAARRTGT
jgi:AcrR family transcriptional regulator